MKQEDLNPDSGAEEHTELFRGKIPVDLQEYHKLYHASIERRNEFWAIQAERLVWENKFTIIAEEDFPTASIAWFPDGKLNACKNALDNHIDNGKGTRRALVYSTQDSNPRSYSYYELREAVKKTSAALAADGYKSGDRVALYMPDCPETVIFMLACARLGIIYVPVPFHFNPEITSEIIHDSGASLLVMSPASKPLSYSARACDVAEKIKGIRIITVMGEITGKSRTYQDFLQGGSPEFQESSCSFAGEHPLCIIYANSAAGIPRGSVYATGGFLVQSSASFDYIFQSAEGIGKIDNVVCTMNLVSAAGQSYGLWGPLLNGSCIFFSGEGEEISVDNLRAILNECDSSVLLTTPRMLTALKYELQNSPLCETKRFSLVACSGDVITPRLVSFAGKALASGTEHVLNLWIQSESGTALINTYPNREINRPGALGIPFLGIKPLAMNNFGKTCRTNESGQLVFAFSWPGMIRTIWGQPERFKGLYFQRLPGYFMTNDGVRIDNDGFFWFMGRLDDVIKVRGQSLATSEIEAALVSHLKISEAAVVSIPGEENENLIAFLTMEKPGFEPVSKPEIESLESELSNNIIRHIGEFALPYRYIFAHELPRTRTGKLVRRILRRIATGDISQDEDLSHVANPHSVDELIRKKG